MAEVAQTNVANVNAEASVATAEGEDPAAQFRGVGVNFKAKLIGIDDVADSRGDKMCQDSILKLKAAVKIAGVHKQKILVNISLEGLKILDLLTGEVQHAHPVNKISFVARDLTDRRAFGYIFSADDGQHKLFGIKTAKVAETLVLSLRDLFQVVYDLRKQGMDTYSAPAAVQQAAGAGQAQAQTNLFNAAATPQQQQGQQEQLLNAMESMNQFKDANVFADANNAAPATGQPDLFGAETFGAPQPAANADSLVDDLSSLSMPAEQPPPVPGANLTNDQILNQFKPQQQPGFGGMAAPMGGGMYQQQQQQQGGMQMPFQQQQQPGFAPQQQQMMMGAPQQQQQSNPFGANAFGQQPQMGMYQQQQQIPQVPPRTGQMLPMQQQQQPGLFGGGGEALAAPTLSPQSPSRPAADTNAPPAAKDPFSDLLPSSIGSPTTAAPNNFKNFEMAKPQQQQQPSGIDNYLVQSKGVLPVNDNRPTAMPRGGMADNSQNLFG